MLTNLWARDWHFPLIKGRSEEARIPADARNFLVSFGLPRVIVFELRNAFEISFKPIENELVSYTSTFSWGDFYDEALDRAWHRQLVIGEEVFCNGHASICIHEHTGIISRLDCELDQNAECFINSSVELYGMSLLVAQKWSATHQTEITLPTEEAVKSLARELRHIDPHAFEEQASFWPNIIECVLENPDDDPLKLEITSNPASSKPRF